MARVALTFLQTEAVTMICMSIGVHVTIGMCIGVLHRCTYFFALWLTVDLAIEHEMIRYAFQVSGYLSGASRQSFVCKIFQLYWLV